MKALLDTHVLLFWLESAGRLSEAQQRVIRAASAENPLLLSEISLWEVATLHDLGRLELRLALREWLEQAAAPPLVRRLGISPAVAAEVAALPPHFHRDPADRILVATARIHGATLLTHDRRILAAEVVSTLS